MTPRSLEELLDRFIDYKHSLGYVYDTQERYLCHYRDYMRESFPDVPVPDKESTDGFLSLYQGLEGGLYNAMAPLREFSRYLCRIGYKDAYAIPPKQMPRLHPEPPYFLSEKETSAFFASCDRYFTGHCGPAGRGIVMPAEFRLLYCCGLRPKEARTLLAKDVNLPEKYIDIPQSKGPKSRRIYISDDLADYLGRYESAISGMFPGREYFFPKSKDRPYSVQFIYYNFSEVWKLAFPGWDGNPPRLYSFRHHFAWAAINRWAREGTDVNAMLPYLMRYMGHNCIKHTLYYFRFVPDFYADYTEISKRLNSRIPEVSDE